MPAAGIRISVVYPPYSDLAVDNDSSVDSSAQLNTNPSPLQLDRESDSDNESEIPPYLQSSAVAAAAAADNVLRLFGFTFGFGDLYADEHDCRALANTSAQVPSHYRTSVSPGTSGTVSTNCLNRSLMMFNASAGTGAGAGVGIGIGIGVGLGASGVAFSLPAQVVTGVLTLMCSFVTVAGNLMVLFSFLIERSLRQATNYFIFSLAVTDVLIGLLSMNFYSLYIAMGEWPLGEITCDLWLALDFTVCLASQYTVFFITVDRFCSVTIPTAYRNWRTDGKLLTMALGSWIVPVSIFFPVIIGWPYFAGRTRKKSECYADFQQNPWFTIGLTVCYYWVTLIVMLSLYAEIYKVALRMQTKSEQKRQNVQTAFQRSVRQSNERPHAADEPNTAGGPSTSRKPRRKNGSIEKSSSAAAGSESDQQSDESKEKKCEQPESKALLRENSVNNRQQADVEDDERERERERGGTNNSFRSHARLSAKLSASRTEVVNTVGKLKTRIAGPKSSNASANASLNDKKAAQKNENRARKALKTITFIMGCFVACWTPYHIVVLIDSICKVRSDNPDSFQSVINVHINNMSYWLCYLNSPINPFCYAFVNVQFKKAFLRILRFDLRIK